MKFIHALAPAALGAAAGFKKPLYFISTGYGAAIALQAVSAMAGGRWAAADRLGRLHLVAMAAYGARLAGFVVWRDGLPSYQGLKQEHDSKMEGLGLGKLAMWGAVTPLYWAMFRPAFLNSAAAAGAAATPAATAFSMYVGAPLMLGALLWEAVADYQQQKDKEAQAVAGTKKPCMNGLWGYSRQANYFGEATFWLANYATALRAYGSVPQALGAAVGVVGIVAIIASECQRRSKQRDRRYGGQAYYEQYKSDVAQVVPGVHWISFKTVDPADDKPQKFRL